MESASILARLSSCAHAGSRPMDPAMPCSRARSARINSFKRHLVQPQRDSVAHVDASERQELFDSISPMYDRLNDVLSLGLHRVWKRMAVKWSGARPGDRVLDLCCGSGDLTFLLGEAVGPRGQVGVGPQFSHQREEISSACAVQGPSGVQAATQTTLISSHEPSPDPTPRWSGWTFLGPCWPVRRSVSLTAPASTAWCRPCSGCRATRWTCPSQTPASRRPPWATVFAT